MMNARPYEVVSGGAPMRCREGGALGASPSTGACRAVPEGVRCRSVCLSPLSLCVSAPPSSSRLLFCTRSLLVAHSLSSHNLFNLSRVHLTLSLSLSLSLSR